MLPKYIECASGRPLTLVWDCLNYKNLHFNTLSKNNIAAENYPFCTIEPNTGIVEVPDERLNSLTNIFNPEKTIHNTVEFIDIAGLVKNAHQGEGLGNQFLSQIRSVNVIIQVVRFFNDNNITHVENRVDPLDDMEIINTELILADIKTVERSLEKNWTRSRIELNFS